MGLDPEEYEKGWAKEHPGIVTFLIILLVVVIGTTLKVIQMIYYPVEEAEYFTPVFINESFDDVRQHFDIYSDLSDVEQKALFEDKYQYNVVRWRCKQLGCQDIAGQPTLKLICEEEGLTEDVRVVMQDDCDATKDRQMVMVAFQLLSKTSGSYFLGRAGVVEE